MESDEPGLRARREVPDISPLARASRAALAIRHGARQGGDVALDSDGLTDAGREMALRLGERIGPDRDIRLFSSPIGRCLETAELIAEGAGSDARVTVCNMLARPGPFPIDEDRVGTWCRERTLHQFMRDWVGGIVPASTIGPIPEGARALVGHVISRLREREEGLDIHVGHDIFLTPVPVHYLGYDVCSRGLLGFLDGFTAVMDGDEAVLSHDGRSVRLKVNSI